MTKAIALLLALFVGWVACALWTKEHRRADEMPRLHATKAGAQPDLSSWLLTTPCIVNSRTLPIREDRKA